jgi:hypothetical protein
VDRDVVQSKDRLKRLYLPDSPPMGLSRRDRRLIYEGRAHELEK